LFFCATIFCMVVENIRQTKFAKRKNCLMVDLIFSFRLAYN
jgi:hypothetical protein